MQIAKCPIVEIRISSRITCISLWNNDHHALPRPGEKHSIGILLERLALERINSLPATANE